MEIYLSYEETDTGFAHKLAQLLEPASRKFCFQIWDRGHVLPGAKWNDEIERHLHKASLFVPLISSSYFSSDRCDKELRDAFKLYQQSKLLIAPILVRECLWQYSQISLLPIIPKNKKPFKSWKNQQAIWRELQNELLLIILEIVEKKDVK